MADGLAWGVLAGAAAVSVLLLAPDGRADNNQPRVLLVGDSLAVGLTGPLANHAARARADFASSAAGSTTAIHWKTRLAEQLVEYGPDLVLFCLGTNDCHDPGSRACAELSSNAAELTAQAEAVGASVLWLVPTWLSYSERIADALDRAGVGVLFAPDALDVAPDRIHLTRAGYADWAATIAGEVFQ